MQSKTAVTPAAALLVHSEAGNVSAVCCFLPLQEVALPGNKSELGFFVGVHDNLIEMFAREKSGAEDQLLQTLDFVTVMLKCHTSSL